MRQWHPQARDEALDDVYAGLADRVGARWVALGMIASIDGAVAVDGRSGGLGGVGDLAGFRALRAAADVVLVGAGTARREGYGPAKVRPAARARRAERGQSAVPPIAVVSHSLDLRGADRLLATPDQLYVVTTTTADADRRRALEDRGATMLDAGRDTVDVTHALAALAERGLGRVLVEGGPTLNGQLLVAGLVDELFVTLGPCLVGSDGPGLAGPPLAVPVPMTLLEGRVHADEVLLRYAVDGSAHG